MQSPCIKSHDASQVANLIVRHPRGWTEGGNPREVLQGQPIAAGHSPLPLLKIVRFNCLDCCCGDRTEVARSGCVIRLWPDDAVNEGLAIGEGIETTLAAATRIEHRGTLLRPAWATGSAGNMATFPVLAGIEALTILVDHDASGTGQKAAEACAQRWRNAGREVIRLMPGDMGADFNNLVTP
jgi:Toprim domain